MTELTRVTFEPDTVAIYVDGELYSSRHTYEEADMVAEAAIEHNITSDETRHYHFDTWNGVPQTLEEAEEMYGDTE